MCPRGCAENDSWCKTYHHHRGSTLEGLGVNGTSLGWVKRGYYSIHKDPREDIMGEDLNLDLLSEGTQVGGRTLVESSNGWFDHPPLEVPGDSPLGWMVQVWELEGDGGEYRMVDTFNFEVIG